MYLVSRGCLLQGRSGLRGCLVGGCLVQGVVSGLRGVSGPRGGCLPGEGHVCPGGVPRDTHPPVDRMTHTYKNITFPQTLFAGGNKHVTYFA